ncbi:Predicted periplasmic lipoprotein [Phocoenobacter uteri]|uniref:Predicted periplasmic lipoprotein n=1 Tax=Phocoenobacter uteri TaxID=146806 RepID=A0A379CBV9_9PAST|nr:YcfL family protein [Phocoenobacter uteri]MDG6881183.1 hypothetical protein [Phocoenobacter uteri]SUB59205.1 Predicted periplasmic lipoprotein [Phocoenobacter uteri]
MKKIIITVFAILLSGCINRSGSLIEVSTKPLVNIDENIASMIEVEAKPEQVLMQNLTAKQIKMSYKFFWFDEKGTSQLNDTKWHKLTLEPHQAQQLLVEKPNQQSYNYRIYLRHKG